MKLILHFSRHRVQEYFLVETPIDFTPRFIKGLRFVLHAVVPQFITSIV